MRTDVTKALKKEVNNLKHVIASLQSSVLELEQNNSELQTRCKLFEEELYNVNIQQQQQTFAVSMLRRSSLIFSGVPETTADSSKPE